MRPTRETTRAPRCTRAFRAPRVAAYYPATGDASPSTAPLLFRRDENFAPPLVAGCAVKRDSPFADQPVWVVTDWADAREVLGDAETPAAAGSSSVEPGRPAYREQTFVYGVTELPVTW